MLQKIYFMLFERYIPELKKYDGISFLHQPMTSGQPLKIVQRHMAHPVHTPNEGKSKISANFGLCGRQNMLWPYLKIRKWE